MPPDAAIAPVAKAGLSVAESGLLGALVVIFLGIAIFAVVALYRAQNQRVDDQKQLNYQSQKNTEKTAEIIEKFNTAFAGFKTALEKQDANQQESYRLLEALSAAVQATRSTVDSVLRDAVRGDKHQSSDSNPGRYHGRDRG
jgi:flagellar biosynthesis/type III secretory pathway M-ring protein FliF/YscJ